jgi:hypothetical protein
MKDDVLNHGNRRVVQIEVPFEAAPGVAHIRRQPIRKLAAHRRGDGSIRAPRVGGSGTTRTPRTGGSRQRKGRWSATCR